MATRVDELADYILRFQPHCDRYLRPIAQPTGKSVLVLGSGHGTELLWCVRNGAAEVVGVDVAERSLDPVHAALERSGESIDVPVELLRLGAESVDQLGRQFDLVLSNNVFEHLPDVEGSLRAAAKVIAPLFGRIAIFTDPLFYSSHGSHLPVGPWEHLWADDDRLREAAGSDYLWNEYTGLNRMTLTSFLEAIRNAGLAVLHLQTVPSRSVSELHRHRDRIPPEISTTDLSIEGIQAELMRL